jgi:hypothetical protein
MRFDSCERPNQLHNAELVVCIPVVGFANAAAAAKRLICGGYGLKP